MCNQLCSAASIDTGIGSNTVLSSFMFRTELIHSQHIKATHIGVGRCRECTREANADGSKQRLLPPCLTGREGRDRGGSEGPPEHDPRRPDPRPEPPPRPAGGRCDPMTHRGPVRPAPARLAPRAVHWTTGEGAGLENTRRATGHSHILTTDPLRLKTALFLGFQ